ncbi:M28 family peptidase [Devosia sp. WQ 349]|uniref:M28 family peptidase n=1 Tax=Devosia sp. WQ 349K1 TaxID=2800329 RepID=UPI001908ED16|nr:M28 family peptidase [Devosia sp. WQ 349K1]MBK1792978.1 M28 family peptidase [Devosia sp. WQ 349K1]
MKAIVPQDLLNSINGPLMWEHLVEFSKWRKESGIDEELKSLAYIQAQMNSYGFKTDLILHDAYISLPQKARIVTPDGEHRCITHSFSQSSPAEGITAGLVDVGSGSAAEFAGKDVRGKIVIVDGVAGAVVSQRATEAGALGQLHVSPHEHTHEMCISPVWGSPTEQTVGNLPQTVVVSTPLENGTAIRAKLVENPGYQVTLHADVDTRWRKTPILVADLPSATGDDEEPFVFFTGHHDTWYYGVMDNGGANATMMEVGRVAAERRDLWQRGLRIVFWSGHSQGRYSGSTWYAEEHWEELEKRALVHVNVDSTGGKGNIIVTDTTAAAELRALAVESIWDQAQQEFSNRRMARAGDQSFWGIGVSAIYGNMSEQPAGADANASAAVFGGGNRKGAGTGWWWHTPDDLLDKMDEEILVRDTKIYFHTVWRLLADKVLPLDWAEHGRYLSEELNAIQAGIVGKFDMSVLIERANRLTEIATAFNARLANLSDAAGYASANAALIGVSRQLVILDYSEADRFEQDAAIMTPIYPSLRPLRDMAQVEAGTDAFKFLTVGASRARNRVAWGLKQAIEILEQASAELDSKQN